MKGWLIGNGFLKTEKFCELYDFFLNSAKKLNVDLELKYSSDLTTIVAEGFSFENAPDFVLFWDKDIYLATLLENAGIKVFNSADAINICDNKILTALKLKNEVPTPETMIVPKTFENVGFTDTSFLNNAEKLLGYPMVIKEAYGSFGQQVYLANDRKEAENIVKRIDHKDCLIQKYVSSSYGKDLRLIVVGDEVIAAMLRVNENDFRSNVTNGGHAYPYIPSDEQKALAVKTCKIIGLDFAGVDILFDENGTFKVCEVNSNPHFASTYRCTGVDASFHILNYILNRIKK